MNYQFILKINLNVKISEQTEKELEYICERYGESKSSVIRRLIQEKCFELKGMKAF